MKTSERHVNHWDVRVERDYDPHYFLGGGRLDGPIPPVTVQISATFDDHDAALDFERKVRDLLEQA